MNYLRTAVSLAGLTALFMAVGGGGTGAVIALLFAAATVTACKRPCVSCQAKSTIAQPNIGNMIGCERLRATLRSEVGRRAPALRQKLVFH